MNIILAIIAVILLLIISTNFIYLTPAIDVDDDTSVSNTKNADTKAIENLIGELKENWNEGDGVGYGNLFDKQAEYITFLGERLIGSEQIASAHQKLFNGVLKGSRMQNPSIKRIQFLSDSNALIITTGAVNPNPKKEVSDNRKSIQTLTAIKKEGIWIFSSFQNTRIQRLSLFDILIGAVRG